MPFNKNQYFYAALCYAASLPEGKERAAQICELNGMPIIDFPVVSPLTPDYFEASFQQFCIFFNALRESLETGMERILVPAQGDGKFMRLGYDNNRSASLILSMTGANFSGRMMDEIEATVFLHDNGQIFARRQQQDTYYMAEIDYPGKPCLPYRCLGLNETIETSNLPQIQTAHFVRIVPVEQGQDYTIISTNKGVRKESKAFASSEDMVIAVPCDSVKNLADLLALTDAEIIAGSGINHSGLHMMSSYTKPLSHSCGLPTVERTPDPRIYRQLSAPSPCLVATETMQIGYGLTFALAQPGDILMIKEKTNTAGRLIRKEAVADGSVQLINKTPLIPSARKFTGRRL